MKYLSRAALHFPTSCLRRLTRREFGVVVFVGGGRVTPRDDDTELSRAKEKSKKYEATLRVNIREIVVSFLPGAWYTLVLRGGAHKRAHTRIAASRGGESCPAERGEITGRTRREGREP